MFNNLTPYTAEPPIQELTGPLSRLEEALSGRPFHPPLKQEPMSRGWVPVLPGDDALAHDVNGCAVIRLRTDEKVLPPRAVQREVNERVEEIEQDENRKVGRRERSEIRERVVLEALPTAPITSRYTLCYFDAALNAVIVSEATESRTSDFLTVLRDDLGSLPVQPMRTAIEPAQAMTDWLLDENPPTPFAFNGECVLEDTEGGGTARFKNVDLTSETVREHLRSGMLCNTLALEFDDRSRFTLTDDLRLKKFKLSDVVLEEFEQEIGESADPVSQTSAHLHMVIEEVRKVLGALDHAMREGN